MRCGRVRKLLSEYKEKNLAAPLNQRIAYHLGECSQCSYILEGLEKLSFYVSESWTIKLSTDFNQKLLEKTKLLDSKPVILKPVWRRNIFSIKRIAVVTASVAVLLSGLTFYKSWKTRTPASISEQNALNKIETSKPVVVTQAENQIPKLKNEMNFVLDNLPPEIIQNFPEFNNSDRVRSTYVIERVYPEFFENQQGNNYILPVVSNVSSKTPF